MFTIRLNLFSIQYIQLMIYLILNASIFSLILTKQLSYVVGVGQSAVNVSYTFWIDFPFTSTVLLRIPGITSMFERAERNSNVASFEK